MAKTKIEFPHVLAAVREAEASLWEIGDALIAELGPPQRSLKAYADVAAECDIRAERLKRLHRVALTFRPISAAQYRGPYTKPRSAPTYSMW